jgi:parallel beta helix pectate lyase-like protein
MTFSLPHYLAAAAVAAAAAVGLTSLSSDSGKDVGSPQAAPVLTVDRGAPGCDDSQSRKEVLDGDKSWCSASAAIATAPSAAVVALKQGSYPALQIGGRKDPVTIRKSGPGAARVAGVRIVDSSGVKVKGLRITDFVSVEGDSSRVLIADNDISPAGVAIRREAKDVRIEDNAIHDISFRPNAGVSSGYGIWVSSGLGRISGVRIVGNRIYGVAVDAIQLAAYDVTVERNDISGVRKTSPLAHPDSIQVLGGVGYRIRSNFIHDSPEEGLLIANARGVVIENNVIARIGGWATQLGQSPGARIMNNTWWRNGFGDLLLRSGANDATVVNNIMRGSPAQAGVRLLRQERNLIQTGSRNGSDLTGSARFKRPGENDFSLRLHSKGVDAGSSRGTPRRDRLGHRRVDQKRIRNTGTGRRRYYDIGAHELATPKKRKRN